MLGFERSEFAEDVSRKNAGTENNANEAKAWIDGNKFAEGSVSANTNSRLIYKTAAPCFAKEQGACAIKKHLHILNAVFY